MKENKVEQYVEQVMEKDTIQLQDSIRVIESVCIAPAMQKICDGCRVEITLNKTTPIVSP